MYVPSMLNDETIDFAGYLADEARKITKSYYHKSKDFLSIESKEDGTPATEADRKVEEMIRKLIQINHSEHGIFGEEFGEYNENAEFKWVIDPIDGTKSFMSGRPLFGTLIALLQNGKPILGIIDQPITEERWIGVNEQTLYDNIKPVKTRECKEISDACMAITTPDMFDKEEWEKVCKARQAVSQTIFGGDCYSYGQLAMGGLDVIIESDLKPYDYMALIPVVENAGGIVTDWQGDKLTMQSQGQLIACGDKDLHAKILELLS